MHDTNRTALPAQGLSSLGLRAMFDERRCGGMYVDDAIVEATGSLHEIGAGVEMLGEDGGRSCSWIDSNIDETSLDVETIETGERAREEGGERRGEVIKESAGAGAGSGTEAAVGAGIGTGVCTVDADEESSSERLPKFSLFLLNSQGAYRKRMNDNHEIETRLISDIRSSS